MKRIFLLLIVLLVGLYPVALHAQAEPEDIASASDAFQESFFESLKQKAIENYDKAIESLEKCLKLEPDNAVVLSELGKNYLHLKRYREAYDAYEKATKLEPKNRWYLAGMYDVTYETQDYNNSIVLVQRLIPFEESYKEDLASLYMKTGQFDKALVVINELNETVGHSDKRDLYKADILKDSKYQGSEKDNLIAQIKKNPKEESNYISLIYLYSNSNQEEKAQEIARQLEKEIPTSDWAQVSLFKFHLNNNDGDKAVVSMNQALKSTKVDNKVKQRMINEFLIFTKNNPKYDADLEKAIGYVSDDKSVNAAKEIAKFYQNKKDWIKAAKYYEIDAANHPDDIETTVLLLQAYTENKQFDVLAKKADNLIELFPLQPELYYFSGLAHNQLKEFKKAKETLETGIDYLVDNRDLEINFNIQLGEAYNGLGDAKKKEQYFLKADQLLKKKK
ncbi:MAG: cytochrome C biosynthesis protein [Flavobacterium sp. BFFFF1]|uniref:tetratricopeptide repeat protein n=1 Tax=Flavobacterium sp. BFFFF1 TaxID=2015557 RepID=UPI000BD3EE89|nr:tetratricopeptide repeat protein [Flavobacterium sp. BFFFF1]OYU79329.1 MAG: cytochrome C biosynthesis protein [Flavobacterium sp. BFFFF1]